jgi:hypothetical protein
MRRSWCQWTIKHNAKCRRPSRWVFVDTETEQTKPHGPHGKTHHRLRLGVACFVKWRRGSVPTEDWRTFTEPSGFWQLLDAFTHKSHPVWLYAHNAMFDLTILNLWEQIEKGAYKIRWMGEPYLNRKTGKTVTPKEHYGTFAVEGKPFIVESMSSRGRVNFLDSMNYFDCSLADLGEMVGVHKMGLPTAADRDDVWQVYCQQDVQILKTAVLDLAREWERDDNGNWQPTGPALAWSHFRHAHYNTPIVNHDCEPGRRLEWDAYYPGECRAFFFGEVPGPVVHYDVNSLYPAMMIDRDYPIRLIDHVLSPRPSAFEHLRENYCVIAEVTLQSKADRYPVRRGGRVYYPTGRFRTFLAGPELQTAWDAGCVAALHAVNYYARGQPFGSYVARWYAEKRAAEANGNQARRGLSKLLLNGLYGKFAQQSKGWKTCPDVDVVRPWKSFPWNHPQYPGNLYARSVGWEGQILTDREDTAHTFPAIPAYVTSYSREFMRMVRSLFPPRTVVYQDTDSLFVLASAAVPVGAAFDLIGPDLGQLRLVGTYENMTIRGPRNYTVDGRHVISGVRRKDIQVGYMEFSGERFERAPSILTREPDGVVKSWTTQGTFLGACHEGGYGNDGWTYPLELA